MIRKGHFKLIHYVGFESPLFDLESDAEKIEDLSGRPEYADILADLEACLSDIVDPEAVDVQAKKDQAALLKKHRGRSAVIAKGTFGPTPVPGEKVEFTSAHQWTENYVKPTSISSCHGLAG